MIQRLFRFLQESPVQFLACDAVTRRLSLAGYRRLDPQAQIGTLRAGEKFYVTKNDSSVYAVHIGAKPLADAGFNLICAHSDSPTFRLKPNAVIAGGKTLAKLNVEAYGGAILSTWFDRPLSLAGRVMLKNHEHPFAPISHHVHIKRPLMTIPNLCIHFNREVNKGVSLSIQKDMQPIVAALSEQLSTENCLHDLLSEVVEHPADILDYDLYLYDTTPPCTFGVHDEFISAGRLDDLEMVSAGLEALIAGADETPDVTRILAVFDNEETGSLTKQGAASSFFPSLVERVVMAQDGTREDYFRAVEKAFMVSADNAHAWHPNYPEKYDPACYPVLGGGPVIKFNAAQKYASDARSAAVFQSICTLAGVPFQRFVNHGDVAGGSTLGNILTANMPIAGVDMGNAILAMHSVRETASVLDYIYCVRAFEQFYDVACRDACKMEKE